MSGVPNNALKVFLCHASGDKPYVRDLYKRLVREGIDVWLDQEKLLPGQDWRVEIPRAVQEADVVVICLSHKSITKEGYIQKEIKFALDSAEEKPDGTIFLIPARIEDCPVPEKLTRWQWVDLFEENGYIKLLRSLKLRADRVGAKVTPSLYEDLDTETEHRLDQYYTEGLAAFYTEDWNKACQRFQAILSERPNHKNALEKLEEAERRRDLSNLYTQAANAYQAQNWEYAITTLNELMKKSPEYKDAAQLLKHAKKQEQLVELYFEAKKLHNGGKWQAVLRVFEQIHALEPNHLDPDGLLPTAQKEAEELKRLADLNDLYSRALREMDLGKWLDARTLLEQVHKSQTGFLETERLLQKIEDELHKIEENEQRINQINILYEQAHGLVRTKKWRKALDKIEEIRKLDSKFEDKDGIIEKISTALSNEELEAQKQNRLDALYAEAVRVLKEDKYDEALSKWEQVRAIDPKYPDRQWISRKIRLKTGKIGSSSSNAIIKWMTVITLLVVVMAGIILVINGVKYRTIEIPSTSTTGVKFQVPLTGFYTFRYSDSAFAAATSTMYTTFTVCFKGEEPIWSGNGLDGNKAIFSFVPVQTYSTKSQAIAEAMGVYKKVRLQQGDWVTCLVGDGKSDYYDNIGTVIWDVYFSLR
ncbi:MAG: TIR domain-containing protein [Anaerolineales bacterium]|nr:TIR domain-containing protein [Anaerolineales bacterium]